MALRKKEKKLFSCSFSRRGGNDPLVIRINFIISQKSNFASTQKKLFQAYLNFKDGEWYKFQQID